MFIDEGVLSGRTAAGILDRPRSFSSLSVTPCSSGLKRLFHDYCLQVCITSDLLTRHICRVKLDLSYATFFEDSGSAVEEGLNS